MCIKKLAAAAAIFLLMTGCGAKDTEEDFLSQDEKEIRAISRWFSESITDEEEFTDVNDYRYYARTIGLDKDALLSPDMWEIFYSEEININREIDNKAVYLIRLNPEKLLDVYAENNNSTADEICAELSVTPEQLYYNFGYTAAAVDYTNNHRDGYTVYSEKEASIFGRDNGENRKSVMSTHFLTVDIANKNSVTYSSENTKLKLKRRDLLCVTSDFSYDYSDYTDDEKNPAITINGIGIRSVLPLSMTNGYTSAADTDITVMFNYSPFSYGCTDGDKIKLPESEVSE